MKDKIIVTFLTAAMTLSLLSACGSNTVSSGRGSDAGSEVASDGISDNADAVSADSAVSSDSSAASASEADAISADALKDDFASTLSYIKKNSGKTVLIDYSRTIDIDGLIGEYTPSDEYQDIEDSLASDDRLTRTRVTRKDNGSTMDVDVYRNISTYAIDKIVTTEYGDSRRLVSGWYFRNRNVIYEYQFYDDLYGSGQNKEETSLDTEAEAALMYYGYITYDAIRQVPGYAKVYGYVGDEFGGILKNVHVTIRSAANSYEEKTETDGDGYYEFYVPVNEADWYNISFTYGDFTPDSLNDINITPGTIEYSCGEMYMAAKGQNVHDTDIYLMNINKKATNSLKDDEYEVVLSYDSSKASLKPYSLDLSNAKTSSNAVMKIKAGSSDDFKYYVTDSKNTGTNNMAYDMSKCDAVVTVYSNDGIVASFLAPAAHAGVVWEVFEISGGKIIPINNCYSDTSSGLFLK